MNPIFSRRSGNLLEKLFRSARIVGVISFVILVDTRFALFLPAQGAGDAAAAEFKRISQELSAARLSGEGEKLHRLSSGVERLINENG